MVILFHFHKQARGVSVLVHRKFHFQLLSVTLDRNGTYVLLNCLYCISQTPFLLIGVYIPPPYSSNVIKEMLECIASYPHIPCIWLGDFNCPWDKFLDCFNLSLSTLNAPWPSFLQLLLSKCFITDAWRAFPAYNSTPVLCYNMGPCLK